MLFHADKVDVDFEIRGRRYRVPVGCEVEIPDEVAYVIASRGIQLAAGPSPEKGAQRVTSEVVARAPVSPLLRESLVSKEVAADELADASGEDPAAEGDEGEGDGESDDDAAQKTLAQLERQGIKVPGKPPGKRR